MTKFTSTASVLALALAVAAPAFAQTATPASGATVGEVIVTAQRRAENLQNVPIAVQAVTPAQIVNSGVTDTRSLSVLVPGLQVSVSAGNSNTYIRGVGSEVVGPALESPVALYVDNVYYASTFGAPANLFDIQQVEVLKGPQGTLFGRNATGGLLQIITKTPSQTPHADAEFSYGNYNTSTLNFYGTTGVAPNLAADFTLHASHQGDGYGVNLLTGKKTDNIDSDIDARSKWVYTPSDKTKLTVIFDYGQIRSSLNSLRILPGTGTPPFLGPPYGGSPWDTDVNTQPVLDHKGGGVSVRLEQDLGFAELIDTAAYRQGHTITDLDLDTTATNFSNASTVVSNDREYTEELQLQSNHPGRVKWIGGVFYFYDNSSIDELVTFGPVFRALSHLPFTGQHIAGVQTAESVAGYVQATIELLPDTNLTLGDRYTWEERTLTANEQALAGPVVIPLIANFHGNQNFYRDTYRIALDHRFSPDLMAYLALNTGFKSGGYNALSATQPPFGPEKLTAYSGGFKSDLLGKRLRFNVEGFYYDYSQLQVAVILTPAPGVTSPGVINGGTAHVYGFDSDLVAQLTDAFRVTAGLEVLHSRFITSSNNFTRGFPSGEIPELLDQNVSGNTLPYSPSAVFNIAGDYTFGLAGGQTNVNLTYQYNNGYFPEPDNVIRQPAFSLLNASIRWVAPNGRYSLALWGKNLTNAVVMQNELTITFGPHGASYLPPRTYGFTVGAHF